MNLQLVSKIKFFLLAFVLVTNFNYSNAVQAKPRQANSDNSNQNTFSHVSSYRTLKMPSRGAPVGRRRGGTSRNSCPTVDPLLTALVPGQETVADVTESNSFLASTVLEKPTFWIYLPQLPDSMRTGEFVLQTKLGEDLNRIQIELPLKEGIIGIDLSTDNQSSLEIGKKYQWYFKIYCDESLPKSDYLYVDAWIERIDFSSQVKVQLQSADKSDYLIYRDANIWYDALTSLGKSLKMNPESQKLKQDWRKLLQSIDLSDLDSSLIVEIYQLKSLETS